MSWTILPTPATRARTVTRMARLVIDLPAAVPLAALHRLAEEHECRIFRRPDGTLQLRPVHGIPRGAAT